MPQFGFRRSFANALWPESTSEYLALTAALV
jgi:hypothetical protein